MPYFKVTVIFDIDGVAVPYGQVIATVRVVFVRLVMGTDRSVGREGIVFEHGFVAYVLYVCKYSLALLLAFAVARTSPLSFMINP